MLNVSKKRIEGRAMALCFTYRPNTGKPVGLDEKITTNTPLEATRSHPKVAEQMARKNSRSRTKPETYRKHDSCLQLLTAF
jgi:hypothetical protein